MKRPVPRRPPLSLLPLLLLVWGLVIWGMQSWGLLPPGFLFGASSEEAISYQIAAAKKAIQKGDQSSAIAALTQASQLLSGPNVPPSAAYALVGGLMTRSGQGTTAAQFLEQAVKQPDLNWDPQIWASLEDANESANNTSAVATARAEADKRANAILATVGQKLPAGKEEEAANRLLEAGMYFADARRDSEKSLKALKEANRLQPDNPHIMNAYGYILADRGVTQEEWDQAKILTRRALQIAREEEQPQIRDSYGWALYRRGDLAGARRVLRETVEELDSNPDVHYHLGVVYQALGQPADARLEIQRALQIDPHFERATDARQRLQDLSAYP